MYNTKNPIWKRYPVITFFVLAYLISWSSAWVLQLIAFHVGLDDFTVLSNMAETTFDLHLLADVLPVPTVLVWILTRIVDFGPTIAGLIMVILLSGKSGLQEMGSRILRWRVSPRWYIIAFGLPLILATASVAIFFSIETDLNTQPQVNILQIPLIFAGWMAIRFLIGGGLGEEVGWRGFALSKMLETNAAIRASLVIGLVWTFWHLPGHLVSDNLIVNLIAQLLITIPYSIILTWIYLKTDQSVFIVALIHAASNAFIGVGMEQVYPVLNDEIGWILIYIVLLNIVGFVIGFRLWRSERVTNLMS